MSELKITESGAKSKNILYIYSSLNEFINCLNFKADILNGKNRCELIIDVPCGYQDAFLVEAIDKMADVIAINYKYTYFKRNIKLKGLNKDEEELLLTALISADLEEDKRYSIKRLKLFKEFSIDGIFNFRMKPLKEKWSEICGYIPSRFEKGQLKDFITYLIKDKCGKRVYVENLTVYDKKYVPLKRRELLNSDSDNLSIIKEILLSCAGEVELATKIDDNNEKYIKEFYGGKVYFSESYFA
ncbi:MAG: hypothetical protein IKV61_05165 [Clostridia bacterium]|nr:hypothetical protein [Clostridia bacterium]